MWPLMCPPQRNLLLLRSQMTYLNPRHSHAIIPLEYEENNISSSLLFFHMMHPPFSFWVHPCSPTVESGSPWMIPLSNSPLSMSLKATFPGVSLLSMSLLSFSLPGATCQHFRFLNGTGPQISLLFFSHSQECPASETATVTAQGGYLRSYYPTGCQICPICWPLPLCNLSMSTLSAWLPTPNPAFLPTALF